MAATKPSDTFLGLTSAGWEFVSSQTASSSSSIDFTGFASGYDYQVVCYAYVPASDATAIYMRMGTGAGPTYQATSYMQANDGISGGVQAGGGDSGSETYMPVFGATVGTGTNEQVSFRTEIYNPADASNFTTILTQSVAYQSSPSYAGFIAGGWRVSAEAHTGVRFLSSSGNIASGEFFLYRRPNA